MSKKQIPEGIKTAIEILKIIVPNLIKFIKSSEWTGRFRKKTDERLSQLEIQVQQLTEAVKSMSQITQEISAEVFDNHSTYISENTD